MNSETDLLRQTSVDHSARTHAISFGLPSARRQLLQRPSVVFVAQVVASGEQLPAGSNESLTVSHNVNTDPQCPRQPLHIHVMDTKGVFHLTAVQTHWQTMASAISGLYFYGHSTWIVRKWSNDFPSQGRSKGCQ